MGNALLRWFASFCLWNISCVYASDEWSGALSATLHGKLIKKHFLAPRVVKEPLFGWFVELDEISQELVKDLFGNLSQTQKTIYDDIDLKYVRLLTDSFSIREWAHSHKDESVTLGGEILEPDRFGQLRAFNFSPEEVIPSITAEEQTAACLALEELLWEPSVFNWTEEDVSDESLNLPEGEPEKLVTMMGKLHLHIFNSDPDRGSLENGGQPIYRWILKLDPKSFEIACNTPVRAFFQTPATIRSFKNCDEMELTGNYDEDWLCEHIDQVVSIQGYLWHAHTGHHHTPVMIDTNPWSQ